MRPLRAPPAAGLAALAAAILAACGTRGAAGVDRQAAPAQEEASTTARAQWLDFTEGRLAEGAPIRWRVTVTSTGGFGGLRAFGHLEGDPGARVQLVLGVTATSRSERLRMGATLEVAGRLLRVPDDGWVGVLIEELGQ